ncbi:MAG: hypothetical protein V5A31_02540 [Haloferacaceae archaeon]
MGGFWGNRRGVTVQIGAILLFGIVVLSLAAYQTTAVPADNERVEFNHNQQVQQDVLDLRNALLRSGTAGGSQSASVALGTTYPARVLFVNPPPPSGRLATGPARSLAVRNVSARDDETRDYLNASANGAYSVRTKPVSYTPSYNVYESAPVTAVGAGTVVNEFPAGNDTALTGQTLVRDNEVYLLAVGGNLSAARSGSVSVDPQALSRSRDATTVADDGTGNVTLVVPTTLSADRWRALLGDEYDPTFDGAGHVYRVSDVPGRAAVEVALDGNQTYRLRTAFVGVGSTGPAPSPAYLTRAGGDDVTVAVRDRYTNPVPNSRVGDDLTVNVTDGRDVLASNRVAVDEDGRATFDYAGETGDVTLTLEAGGSPALDAANGSVEFTVTDADLPGDGGGVGEEINPNSSDGVVLKNAAVGDDPNEVDLTFRNLDDDTARNVSQARFNFYLADTQGGASEGPPKSARIGGTLLRSANSGGRYRSVGPIGLPAGSERTFTVSFYSDRDGTTADAVGSGDFFVLSVIFGDGETATYFVAPTGGKSGSGGGGGGGSPGNSGNAPGNNK